MVHRGSDDEGFYTDGCIAFGFRRLSIIDVAGGHQPVRNEDGSVWCMFNGAVYNYVELRQTLESYGHVFYTKSDTETIVHAYEQFGLDFLQQLRGMFAIALWDAPRRRLVLARDRIGKKPLYYSVNGDEIAFGSEIKGLYPWPGLDRTLDLEAVQDYLRFLYVPAPRSILRSVHKLLPGHLLIADATDGSWELRRYWSFTICPDPWRPEDQIEHGLRQRIEDAVGARMRSDVPLGAFLSGGVDSSTIVAFMAGHAQHTPPLTFSMGFQDPAFDETRYARLIAQHLGTDHHEEVVEPVSQEMLLRIVHHFDEPFADSSAIPTYLLCQTARKHVVVALSGDGGDELFAGYRRYRYYRWIGYLDAVPPRLRRALRRTMLALGKYVVSLHPALAQRVRQFAKALAASELGPAQRSFYLNEHYDSHTLQELLVPEVCQALDGRSLEAEVEPLLVNVQSDDRLDYFLYLDTMLGLPDDMLTKIDRMSMAHGLEVRCPLLDHELVEYAGQIPAHLKLRGRTQKGVMKRSVAPLLPVSILNRRKQGFGMPLGPLLATRFRDLMIDCLSAESVQKRGLFNPQEVIRLRDQALGIADGQRDPLISEYQLWHRIWALLMLELSCRNIFDS